MPIKDYNITDLMSFQAATATNEKRGIAGLYFYQLLDCLVDLAYKVSGDFRKRPQLYRDLGPPFTGLPPIAQTLAELNAKYGTEINFLSGTERNEVYFPIFGTSDGSSSNASGNFSRLRNDLVRAATAFAEGALDHGLPMLRAGVLTAERTFADYLLGLNGDSVVFSKDDALFDLTEHVCYRIIRDQHVAAVFGITSLKGPPFDYPYGTDPAEDTLVEQIAGQLTWRTDVSQAYPALTRERISNLQNAALRGAEAIATAIDFEGETNASDDDLNLLITKCYSWGTALTSLNGQSKGLQSPTQPTPPTSMVARTATPSTMPATVFGQR
jgi:hypothetical protein